MKCLPLLLFAISSSATASTYLDWSDNQLTLTTQVTSPIAPPCCGIAMDSGSFSGTFTLSFSGLDSIYPPGDPFPIFFLTIPVDFSEYTDYPQLAGGTACLVSAVCYSSQAGYPYQQTYLIQYPDMNATGLEPLSVPISLTTSAEAEYHDPCCGPGIQTTGGATVTVDFRDLVLKDAFGNDITSLVSFSVTPPVGLTPEPGGFVLAGAGLLALTLRRVSRHFAQVE